MELPESQMAPRRVWFRIVWPNAILKMVAQTGPPDPSVLGPRTGPKIGETTAKNRLRFLDKCWDQFRADFGAISGVSLGPRSAQAAPRGGQEGQQELQEAKRIIFTENGF